MQRKKQAFSIFFLWNEGRRISKAFLEGFPKPSKEEENEEQLNLFRGLKEKRNFSQCAVVGKARQVTGARLRKKVWQVLEEGMNLLSHRRHLRNLECPTFLFTTPSCTALPLCTPCGAGSGTGYLGSCQRWKVCSVPSSPCCFSLLCFTMLQILWDDANTKFCKPASLNCWKENSLM